ncbi:MAG: hypothetical protein AABX52_04740 [Nanoarchaeota archaeon]
MTTVDDCLHDELIDFADQFSDEGHFVFSYINCINCGSTYTLKEKGSYRFPNKDQYFPKQAIQDKSGKIKVIYQRQVQRFYPIMYDNKK